MAVLVVLVTTATVLVVRADRHEAAVTAEAAEVRHREAREQAAERAAVDRAARAAERDAAAQVVALMWSTVTAGAATQVAAAESVLAESEGKVTDDTVRLALAQALDGMRPLLTRAETPPGDVRGASAALGRGMAGIGAASTAVSEARALWQSEQDAAAEAEAEAEAQAKAKAAADAEAEAAATAPRTPGRPSGPGLGGPPSTGAAADCGSPASYEPPKDDGSPTFYTSTPTASGDGSNGRVPSSAMGRLGWCTDSQGNGQWLRADAAAALTRMNEAFRAEFGENIAVDMSYRSYEDQVAMRAYYGSAAARPGTSNHGLGLAFDTWEWAAYGFGSDRYQWLVGNAPSYGWVAPSWARQGGSNPEYWHFEYAG